LLKTTPNLKFFVTLPSEILMPKSQSSPCD